MENYSGYVGENTIIKNCSGSSTGKIYNNCRVSDTVIGEYSTIGDNTTVRESCIGERSSIQRYCDIWRLKMGRFSCVGRVSTIQATEIGSFCSLSWNLKIGGDDHDYRMITTHPFWHNISWGVSEDKEFSEIYHEKEYSEPCRIGNDVWIGAGVTVCRNVSIGDGCVIGGGAVITKDIEPYSVVVGVPGRIIKKRFDEKIIERLLKTKWWDLPVDTIKSNLYLFRDKHMDEEVLDKLERICYER